MAGEQPRTQSDSFYAFIAWADANKKRLLTWTLGVAVVVLIAIAVASYEIQKEARASEAVSNVRASYSPTQPNPPGVADAYLKVAKEHSGTKAASRAMILAATTRFTDGQYADAQKLFEEFTKQYPESPWMPMAQLGIGASLDAQQKTGDAIAKYEALLKRYPNDPVNDEAKLAVARLYEIQNRPADAYKVYDDLVKANPYGGLGSEAGLRKSELEEKHPELKKVEAPPAPMNATPLLNFSNQNVRTLTNRAGSNMIQMRPMTNRPGGSSAAPAPGPRTQTITIPPPATTNASAPAK
jgi:tetratricopeptide (TPR) repeat protein